jgi:hypothetical protein
MTARAFYDKKSLSRVFSPVIRCVKNLVRPGEQKAGAGPKLRNNPKNLLGIMPAKEG